jgi:hypothetical protein
MICNKTTIATGSQLDDLDLSLLSNSTNSNVLLSPIETSSSIEKKASHTTLLSLSSSTSPTSFFSDSTTTTRVIEQQNSDMINNSNNNKNETSSDFDLKQDNQKSPYFLKKAINKLQNRIQYRIENCFSSFFLKEG